MKRDPLVALLSEWFVDCSELYLGELARQVEFAIHQREHPRTRSYARWLKSRVKR